MERYNFKRDDFLEFIGISRSKGTDFACVLHLVRWTNTVGEIPVRELLDRMVEEGAAKGIFVTASSFSEKAQDLAKIRPLLLLERDRLETMLSKVYAESS